MDKKKPLIENQEMVEDMVAACNRCGFCTSYCPTYNATGNEIHSPRGRNQLFRALLEGKVKNFQEAKESIDTCLLCGECTSVCFSEVPTADLMVKARDLLGKSIGRSFLMGIILNQILPNPAKMKRLLKLMLWGKKMGFSYLLNKIGLLKKISPEAAAADNILDKVDLDFLLERKETFPYQPSLIAQEHNKKLVEGAATPKNAVAPTAKIAYLTACGSQYIYPEIGLATVKLLKLLKVDFVIPEIICCGLPAASYGVLSSVASMADTNMGRLERDKYDALLVDDSSCASHFKDYPKYFSSDPARLKKSHEFSLKGRDVLTFFIQRGLKDHLKLIPWSGPIVAFHDPCKAQYGQKLLSPPRELLSVIPNLKMVPIPDSDQCCGGGGTYSFVHPELSQEVLASKLKNILSTGAKIVVTSSTSCLLQIAAGLRKSHPEIQVMHITQFLLRVLERRKGNEKPF